MSTIMVVDVQIGCSAMSGDALTALQLNLSPHRPLAQAPLPLVDPGVLNPSQCRYQVQVVCVEKGVHHGHKQGVAVAI